MNFKKVLEVISINLGLTYILFILWLRVIHKRLPVELDGNFDSITYGIYLMLFILSLIMFVYYLRKILGIKSKYKLLRIFLEYQSILKLVTFIKDYILNAPYNLYIYIYNKYDILNIIEQIGRFIWNYNLFKYTKIIYIVICFLRFIIVFCFFFDVIIFNKFNFFYKSLILLFVILIIKAIIFVLKDISKDNRTYISENYISVETTETKDSFYLEFQPHFVGEKTENVLQGHYIIWVCYTANCMFADNFYEYTEKYDKYINIIYYGIFTLGWGYIIYKSC